jgi:hypothetical protein
MKSKVLIINIVVLVLFANANTIVAQKVSTAQEWDAVKALVPGEKLSVRLKDGKKVEGIVRGVSDTQLMLTRGSAATDLNRETISKVYRIVSRSTGRSIGKSTAMGAGIGFGIGAGVGIAGGSYEDLETAGLVGLLGGLGAAIGAGIGAVVGAVYVKPGRVLIYEAK